MDGEEPSLAGDSGNHAAWSKDQDPSTIHGLGLKFIRGFTEARLKFHGMDDSRTLGILVLMNGEIRRIEWVRRPVEQSSRQAMMLCDGEPLPIQVGAWREVLDGPHLPEFEHLLVIALEGRSSRLGHKLPRGVSMAAKDPTIL